MAIKGLPNFEYTNVLPIAYRTFLGNALVYGGVSECSKDEWFQIDENYLDRITERIGNLAARREAIAVNDVCVPAIAEVFVQVIRNILIRYPTLSRLEGTILRNYVTDAEYDLENIRKEPQRTLQMLSENVEKDFYLMCPDSDGVFSLQGFVSCFPGGFSSLGKLGRSMRDIHGPVPALNECIGDRIDCSVTGLQHGDIVQRLGWSLQFNGSDLWRTDGNNFYPKPGEVLLDVSETQDLERCYLGVEHQTLVSPEKSEAIVFGIRQYKTPIAEIRKEETGPALADAIASLPEELGYYKMRPFWQRDVDSYLRK